MERMVRYGLDGEEDQRGGICRKKVISIGEVHISVGHYNYTIAYSFQLRRSTILMKTVTVVTDC